MTWMNDVVSTTIRYLWKQYEFRPRWLTGRLHIFYSVITVMIIDLDNITVMRCPSWH